MVVYGKNKVVKTYGLLDGGATRSILKSQIAKDLGLEIYSKETRVVTLDSNSKGRRDFADFRLGNLKGDYFRNVKEAIVDRTILTLDNDIPPTNKELEGLDYAEGVEFEELDSKEIGIILSAEFANSWMGGEYREGSPGLPILFLTKWGWSMYKNGNKNETIASYGIEVDDLELKEDIERAFSRDFEDIVVNKRNLSREDNHALEQFEKSIRQRDNGHWECGLPWKGTREEAAARPANIFMPQ